ncbi:MAG: hypothetical protein HPY57_12695 [Ignavibacteria bacterium]|nr:hypothetical protein [Ignavibacteria bacterium]
MPNRELITEAINITNKNNLIFLPYNVPSLKNSKIVTNNGVFPSRTVSKYLKSLNIQSYSSKNKYVKIKNNSEDIFYNTIKPFFKLQHLTEPPYIYGFHFVRNSKHKFDFINACQILADLFVAYDLIKDDDMDNFIPIPLIINGNYYSYSKTKPGVYIYLFV